MDFEYLKLLASKTRTCHKFEPGQVLDPQIIEDCLNLSLLAPNHRLTFPWKVLNVGIEKRGELANLAGELAKEKGQSQEGVEKAKKKALDPSGLLVFCLPRKPDNPFEEREDYATLSCSIQLLALALRCHNLAYKWSTGGLSRHSMTYKILSLNEDTEEIIGFIWIGIPESGKDLPLKPRPDLKEVLRHTP